MNNWTDPYSAEDAKEKIWRDKTFCSREHSTGVDVRAGIREELSKESDEISFIKVLTEEEAENEKVDSPMVGLIFANAPSTPNVLWVLGRDENLIGRGHVPAKPLEQNDA